MIEIWMENHFEHYKSIMFKTKYQRQVMLGLHLVWVALRGWFTISIEQDK